MEAECSGVGRRGGGVDAEWTLMEAVRGGMEAAWMLRGGCAAAECRGVEAVWQWKRRAGGVTAAWGRRGG